MSAPKGLYNKYRAIKVSTGEDVAGPWFLLRYDRDPHARVALKAYADSVRETNYELSEHLNRALELLGEPMDGTPGGWNR